MTRRIGKAWGNALGGYKVQNRVGGRFSSGFGGASKKITKVNTPTSRSTPSQRRAQYLDSKRKEAQKAKRRSTVKKAATAAAVVGVVGGAAYAANRSGALKVSGGRGGFGATVKARGHSASVSVDRSVKGVSSIEGYVGKRSFYKNVGKRSTIQVAAQPISASKAKSKDRNRIEDVVKGAGGAATVVASVSSISKSLQEMNRPQETDQHGVGKRNELSPQPMAISRSLAEGHSSGQMQLPAGNGMNDPQPIRSKTVVRHEPINWSGEKEEDGNYDGGDFDAFSLPSSSTLNSRQEFLRGIDRMNAGVNAGRPRPSVDTPGQRVTMTAGNVRAGSPQAKRHATSSKSRYSGVVQLQPDSRVIQIDTAALKGDQEAISRAMIINQMSISPEDLYASRRYERKAADRNRKLAASQNPKSAAKHASRHTRRYNGTNWGYVPPESTEDRVAREASAARDASRRSGHYSFGGVVPGNIHLLAGEGSTQKPLRPKTPLSKEAVEMWEDILKKDGLAPIPSSYGENSTVKAGRINVIPYGHDEDSLWRVKRA